MGIGTTINGRPYVLVARDGGYTVTRTDTPQARFLHSHYVRVRDGQAVRCDCGDYLHRGRRCKHIVAVSDLLNTPAVAAP